MTKHHEVAASGDDHGVPSVTTPRAADDSTIRSPLGRPLSIVILGAWMRFPHGMAATNRVLLLSRALVEAGDHVRVLCLQASERPPHVENTERTGTYQGVQFEYATRTTLRHESFLMRRLIAAWGWIHGAWRLATLRRRGQLDVVYLWFSDSRPTMHRMLYLALLRLFSVPVVWELNECPWSLREDATALERSWSPLVGVSGAVTISAFLTDWAQSEARHRRVEVIEVPIVVDVYEQSPSDHPAGEPFVVFAGSPVYDETIRFIFAAMEHVWQALPECRLVVTGARSGDPAARWLLAQGRGTKADPRLDVAGYLPRAELVRLYSRASALLIPLFDDVRSRARFPTKIGEYLASARPIVTTAVGEIPRYFEDNVNAVVCPAGDPATYGRRIVALLNDAELAASIGRQGRRLAEARFHYALYSTVLHRGFTSAAGRLIQGGERE